MPEQQVQYDKFDEAVNGLLKIPTAVLDVPDVRLALIMRVVPPPEPPPEPAP